jgi:uncharacterized membrane protein
MSATTRSRLRNRVAYAILALAVLGTLTAGHLRDHHQPTMGTAGASLTMAAHASTAPKPVHAPHRPSVLEGLCLVAPRAVVALAVGLALLGLARRYARLRAKPRTYVDTLTLRRSTRPPPSPPRFAQLSVLRM